MRRGLWSSVGGEGKTPQVWEGSGGWTEPQDDLILPEGTPHFVKQDPHLHVAPNPHHCGPLPQKVL